VRCGSAIGPSAKPAPERTSRTARSPGGRAVSGAVREMASILNTLGAQDWELNVAVPSRDSDTLLLILSRAKPSA